MRPDSKTDVRQLPRSALLAASLAAGSSVILYYAINKTAGYFFSRSAWLVETYNTDLTFQYAFDSVFIIFALFLPFALLFLLLRRGGWTDAVIPFGSAYRPGLAALLVPAGLAACMAGNFAASYLNTFVESFFTVEFTMPTFTVPKEAGAIALYFVRSAIVPPLIEEFCMRGCVMQPLRRYGDWFAIIMSAFVFALLHGNMVQLPFAFVAGIAIGYCVVVTGSIWTGVAIHFFNNTISVMESVMMTNVGAAQTAVTASVVAAVTLIIGVICLVIYLFMNPHAGRLHPAREIVRRKTLVYLASPAMLAAIGIMIYVTTTWVQSLG